MFRLGYHKYSFAPKCKEVESLTLADGTDRVFICAGGDKDDVSEDMKHLLDYMVGNVAKSDFTSRIDSKVKEAIDKRLWRKEYMTYKEQMDQEFRNGFKLGEEQGLEQGIQQGIRIFIEDKIEDGVSKETILHKLKKRFELTPEKAREYFDTFSSIVKEE